MKTNLNNLMNSAVLRKVIKQNRFNIILICFILFQTIPASSHSYKKNIIIDTDMALDDTRALVMLLNQDINNIHLIVTSDGAVSPEVGYQNLKKLLANLNKKDIKIAIGRELHKKSPSWRAWSEEIFYSNSPEVSLKKLKMLPADTAIVNVLHSTDVPIVYLCLGPFTNLADALKMDSSIKDKISKVIYYGNSPSNPLHSWNTSRDLISAKSVFESGLKIFILRNSKIKNIKFDKIFFKNIKAMGTPAAKLIVRLHRNPEIKNLLLKDHFCIWDEITVIYLFRPILFQFDQKSADFFKIRKYEHSNIKKIYLKLLGYPADSLLMQREVVVLAAFPKVPHLFRKDIRPFVEKIIKRYGMEEWKACVLTNELHRHLGIYSIVGAKMGIRAREILKAPLDSLEVISLAGNKPPLSCLNDGLQVSTGASLGRGTIKILDSNHQPSATFIYKNQKITLKIKDNILKKIKEDILISLKKCGGLSPEYFAHIRRLSINYWYELDRTEIFSQQR